MHALLDGIIGYLWLRNRVLGARAMAVLEAVPGCVLISVIAPAFVSHRPADLAALAVTLAAATRLSLLPTVVVGIQQQGYSAHPGMMVGTSRMSWLRCGCRS